MGKTGAGHSYRNKAKGCISGSDGYLSRKSKRRSRNNSFACQVHLCKVPKLLGRGWVSLARFTDLCRVCMWGLPKHIYLESLPLLLGLKSTLVLNRVFHCGPIFLLHYQRDKSKRSNHRKEKRV